MTYAPIFDREPKNLYIPALGGFYERIAQPMAWSVFRLAIGGMLAVEGWAKITAPFAQIGFVENLGFYPGWLWSPLLAGVQFFGGIMIAIGLLTRPAALANAVMLAVTLFYHFAFPYGDAFLTQAGIDALKAGGDLFTQPGMARLADGGAKFLHQVQGKAEQASFFWVGGAFLYAAFGGGYLSLDRLLFKKQF